MNPKQEILEIGIAKKAYRFSYGGFVFTVQDYLLRSEHKRGILQLLVDGHTRLYKRYGVEFRPATREMGFKPAEPNRFVRLDDEYMVAVGDGMPEPIGKTKELIERLKAGKPDVDQYSKTLRLRSEDGLVQLIEYCNH
ncbi:MAG: hypothetical protein QM786_05450 [Breznakibacter sp.]